MLIEGPQGGASTRHNGSVSPVSRPRRFFPTPPDRAALTAGLLDGAIMFAMTAAAALITLVAGGAV